MIGRGPPGFSMPAMTTQTEYKIVVAGDVHIERFRLDSGTADAALRDLHGGAWRLAEWVRQASRALSRSLSRPEPRVVGPAKALPPGRASWRTRVLRMEPCGEIPKATWRVVANDPDVRWGTELVLPEASDVAADLVVLHDDQRGFARAGRERELPGALASEKGRPLVVLSSTSVGEPENELWHRVMGAHEDRLVVVLEVEALRELGLRIPRALSWERVALDTVAALDPSTLNDVGIAVELGRCRHLVVRYGLEGALLYSHDPKGRVQARLVYDPERLEGDYRRGSGEGEVLGVREAFVAGIVAQLQLELDAEKREVSGVERGVRRGLLAARRLFDRGHGDGNAPPLETDALCAMIYPEVEGTENITPEQRAKLRDPLGMITVPDSRDENWRILDQLLTIGSEEPDAGHDLLRYLVQALVIREQGPGMFALPRARFGKNFRTADRTEIEGYRAVQQLMREYVETQDPPRPLSIAVFGPPGSGKSFGVKSLAQSLDGVEVQELEFNVSQFESGAELVGAFHLVRDAVLKKKLPLVFFDEFDSDSLRWLKYFLAPMQDGLFLDEGKPHPIGKAVFVFAGGTSSSFREFSSRGGTEYVTAKGPDFVSRLRGRIDVKGPNPVDDSPVELRSCRIRRAMLLRSALERGARHLIDEKTKRIRVDLRVLHSLVRVERYNHGARSLESVIDMSLLAGKTHFRAEALPPVSQLELHVQESDELYELLDSPWSAESHLDLKDRLARALHDQYRRDQVHRKPRGDDSMQPWERLIQRLRTSNFQLAGGIDAKLESLGLEHREAPGGVAEPFNFTPQEVERLAEAEHARWLEEAEKSYVPGPRNHLRGTHEDLRPWKDLRESKREYDREIIRSIPLALAIVGREIREIGQTGT